MIRTVRPLLFLLVTLMPLAAAASDWPMFGGNAGHDAVAPGLVPRELNAAALCSTAQLGIKAGSGPVVADGRVYVYASGSPAGLLFCLDATTLGVIWSNSVPVDDAGWGSWATPAVASGCVVFAADTFLGCWTTGGVPAWSTTIAATMNSSPVIAGDKVFIASFHYVNSENAIAAYSLADGALVWNDTNVPVAFSSCTPAINVASRTGYACAGSDVWAFNSDTGSNLWRTTLASTSLKNVSYARGIVLAVNYDVFSFGPLTNLFALDATSGTVRWARVCGGADVPPAVWSNTVVHACGDNATMPALTGYDLFTGSQLWQCAGIGNGGNMPAIADGVAYAGIGVYGGWMFKCMSNLTAVALDDGTVLSSTASLEGGHAAATADNTLFTANNGVLYAFRYHEAHLHKLMAALFLAKQDKDSINLSMDIPLGTGDMSHVAAIAQGGLTLTLGRTVLLNNALGLAVMYPNGMKWSYHPDNIRARITWTHDEDNTLNLRIVIRRMDLTEALPYSARDGVVTGEVTATAVFGGAHAAAATGIVPIKTRNARVTMHHHAK